MNRFGNFFQIYHMSMNLKRTQFRTKSCIVKINFNCGDTNDYKRCIVFNTQSMRIKHELISSVCVCVCFSSSSLNLFVWLSSLSLTTSFPCKYRDAAQILSDLCNIENATSFSLTFKHVYKQSALTTFFHCHSFITAKWEDKEIAPQIYQMHQGR